jgi:DNA-binding CsgD family transcriptional regulator
MYFSKLKDNGVVALHITADESENIEPVISFIARHLKLTAVIAYERYKSSSHLIENKGLVKIPEKGNLKSKLLSGMEYFTNIQLTSDNEEEVYSWVVLGRNKSSIKRLLSESRWHVLDHRAGNVLYTDEIIGYKERKGEITQEVD